MSYLFRSICSNKIFILCLDQSRNHRYLESNAIPSCNLPSSTANVVNKTQVKNNSRKNRYFQREKRKFENNSIAENSINTTDLESSIQDIEDVRNESELDEPGSKESDTVVSPEKQLIDSSIQVTSGGFDVDFFDTLKTDSDLNTFTEIANFKLFDKLIKIVEAGYPIYNSETRNLRNKILIVFMKLKHNVSYAILKAFFKYPSISQCRKIIFGTITKFHFCLRDAVYFPCKEKIYKNIPLCFVEFSDVKVVLDCTEIHIQRPKELCCQQVTYFRYKSDFTIKFMTGVIPGGMISFVSKAYGGKISDDAIFEQLKILDLSEERDAIMVDKGFRVEKLCKKKKILNLFDHHLKEKRINFRNSKLE